MALPLSHSPTLPLAVAGTGVALPVSTNKGPAAGGAQGNPMELLITAQTRTRGGGQDRAGKFFGGRIKQTGGHPAANREHFVQAEIRQLGIGGAGSQGVPIWNRRSVNGCNSANVPDSSDTVLSFNHALLPALVPTKAPSRLPTKTFSTDPPRNLSGIRAHTTFRRNLHKSFFYPARFHASSPRRRIASDCSQRSDASRPCASTMP